MILSKQLKEKIQPGEFYRKELGITARYSSNGWIDGGLCVFHEDRHKGNFKININTGAFKCFACSAKGGDVIAFTQLCHNLTFKEALKHLINEWSLKNELS